MSEHTELETREFSIFLQGQIDFILGLDEETVFKIYDPHYQDNDILVWMRGWNFAEEKDQRR